MNDKKITIYEYRDEQYVTLYKKIRAKQNGTNTFYFEREENGVKICNIQGIRKVLYNLPAVLWAIENGFPIFLVEGEKDADTLFKNNQLFATTTITTLEWYDEYTQILKNADVTILYDNDKTGCKRRDMLIGKLYGKVKRLRVIDLPGIPYTDSHGQDITDWLETHTIEEFKELVDQTPDYKPPQHTDILVTNDNQLLVISLDELFALTLPPRAMLLTPFLPTQGLALLVAKRGVGKTHVALGIAYAVASGGQFLNWYATEPHRVLYIDGEMPAVLMQERLRMIAAMSNRHPSPDFFKLLTPDLQNQALPDFAKKEGRDAIEPLLTDVELVVLDNISCLFRSGSENESESWQEAQEWALDLRRRGKSVLFVHHAGKNGVQRGTSKREDILDTVIILKHTDDYNAEDGARFEIFFDKARHFSGEDARSFQAALKEINGIRQWEVSQGQQEEEIVTIAEMKKRGLTIKDIAKEMGITKSQVESRLKKAKDKGLL